MPAETKHREPKQARSRQSFEKTIEAALALLEEHGSDDFTLADVSARAEVSIGSIYARFDGKDELLRVAHGRKMDDIDAVTAHLFKGLPQNPAAGLRSIAQEAINQVIEVLCRYADILRPFMLRATNDEALSERGLASYTALADHFTEVLRRWPAEDLGQADIDWCFNVVYSIVARRLGLGSTVEGTVDLPWPIIATNLAGMVASYLQTSPSQSN